MEHPVFAGDPDRGGQKSEAPSDSRSGDCPDFAPSASFPMGGCLLAVGAGWLAALVLGCWWVLA